MSVMRLPINYERATPAERKQARGLYETLQNGDCWFCHNPLDALPPKKLTELPINWNRFPEHFQVHPVHLQHDHETGMTEGAVHAFCNAFLWDYLGR